MAKIAEVYIVQDMSSELYETEIADRGHWFRLADARANKLKDSDIIWKSTSWTQVK